MHCKLDHRVGATRAARLNLPPLSVRGCDGQDILLDGGHNDDLYGEEIVESRLWRKAA